MRGSTDRRNVCLIRVHPRKSAVRFSLLPPFPLFLCVGFCLCTTIASMRISSRRGTSAFFVVLGVCLTAVAVALNISWIILNVREVAKLIVGAILFLMIIAGLILNTIFLVREIRRNEQHDSFINAVTHELKTPLASIRLYLETLHARKVPEAQQREFFRIMHEDTDRLVATVDQVLKAAEAGQKRPAHAVPVELDTLVEQCVDLARKRHHRSEERR